MYMYALQFNKLLDNTKFECITYCMTMQQHTERLCVFTLWQNQLNPLTIINADSRIDCVLLSIVDRRRRFFFSVQVGGSLCRPHHLPLFYGQESGIFTDFHCRFPHQCLLDNKFTFFVFLAFFVSLQKHKIRMLLPYFDTTGRYLFVVPSDIAVAANTVNVANWMQTGCEDPFFEWAKCNISNCICPWQHLTTTYFLCAN